MLSYAEHKSLQKIFADPISFELEEASTFEQFYESGFFVDLFTDELSLFRYKYFKEIIFNNSYHLVIVNTPEHELSSAFMEMLQRHMALVASSKVIGNICIEWQGSHILDYFESRIQPFAKYAGKVCSAAGMPLRNQVGVSMSSNEVIHDKLYHKKGVPTYRQTVENLRRICAQGPNCNFRLTVLARPYATTDMEVFWSQFSPDAQRRINLVWQPYKLNEANVDAASESTTLSNRGNTEKNGGLCQQLLPPRLHQVILYTDNSIYMAVPFKSGEDKPQGVLCEDGSIRWNELERENMLSKQWFENHKCRGCKHLPLLVGICSKQKVPLGMICPIDNNLVTPDSVIVKEFENRQL
jgi:hypothetical protein